jgi:hypothetical protein
MYISPYKISYFLTQSHIRSISIYLCESKISTKIHKMGISMISEMATIDTEYMYP